MKRRVVSPGHAAIWGRNWGRSPRVTCKKTLFTVCGASAIENANKLARLYTGRHKIIARYRAFHGASYGAMTAGGDPRKLAVDSQQIPNIVHVEDPYCYRCPWGKEISSCNRECVSHIERVIEFEGPENIAAILMEGESGSSGCIKYPPDYLQKVRALCDKHGILLIADEVMSGFGRTGKMVRLRIAWDRSRHDCNGQGDHCGLLAIGCAHRNRQDRRAI